MFCARLFICALWSPAGKGLTSWLSFVVSSVSLSLSHWYPGSGVVLDCIDSWSLQPYYFYSDWLFHKVKKWTLRLVVGWVTALLDFVKDQLMLHKNVMLLANYIGVSSKFSKSWTLENHNLKLASICFQIIKNSKFNGQIPLDKLKLNQKSYYNLQNSAFWGWLSMES